MASSRYVEVEDYEKIVTSPLLRRSSSAESVEDESPFQEPTLRYIEPELAEKTQLVRKVLVATFVQLLTRPR